MSEILGTLLLGESALAFVSDCRQRLLTPDATIIPAAGVQFVSLIESADIKSITSASNWDGINLEGFDALQDTCNVVFTKQYGFRLSSVPYKTLAGGIPVAEVDFYTDDPDSLPESRRMTVVAEASGTIHAAMLYWEVRADACSLPVVASVWRHLFTPFEPRERRRDLTSRALSGRCTRTAKRQTSCQPTRRRPATTFRGTCSGVRRSSSSRTHHGWGPARCRSRSKPATNSSS